MSSQRVALTYEDYEKLPDDGRRYELHEGELSVTPAPGILHQEASGNLYTILRQHVTSGAQGKLYYAPVDCILDISTVVQPDLVFVDTTRLNLISARGIEGPPTLVVEIVSPSTTAIDRVRKRELYARFGVPYYWIVDGDERSIDALQLADGQYELAAHLSGSTSSSLPPFPDLELEPASIWA